MEANVEVLWQRRDVFPLCESRDAERKEEREQPQGNQGGKSKASSQEMLVLSLEDGSIWSQSTAPRAQDILLPLRAPYSHGLQIPYTGQELVQFHSCCILPQCLEVLQLASSDDSLRPLTEPVTYQTPTLGRV